VYHFGTCKENAAVWCRLPIFKRVWTRFVRIGQCAAIIFWQVLKSCTDRGRVPGLPIRDCARNNNNRAQMCPKLSATDVTEKTFFERLYLFSKIGTFGSRVNCPYAPTTPTVHSTTISLFLWIFFPWMAPQFFCHHDSPSNLTESQYPRPRTGSTLYFDEGNI